MSGQWENFLGNLGEWRGSFTSVSPLGEIGESTAYVGVIAGPTTSLAHVRENARHARLSELVLEAIPKA